MQSLLSVCCREFQWKRLHWKQNLLETDIETWSFGEQRWKRNIGCWKLRTVELQDARKLYNFATNLLNLAHGSLFLVLIAVIGNWSTSIWIRVFYCRFWYFVTETCWDLVLAFNLAIKLCDMCKAFKKRI